MARCPPLAQKGGADTADQRVGIRSSDVVPWVACWVARGVKETAQIEEPGRRFDD